MGRRTREKQNDRFEWVEKKGHGLAEDPAKGDDEPEDICEGRHEGSRVVETRTG